MFIDGNVVSFTFFTIAILFPLLSIVYSYLLYSKFRYTQALEKKYANKGEKIKFNYNIENETFLFYPYIRVEFFSSNKLFLDDFQKQEFSILPFEKLNFNIDIECKYMGRYEFGIQKIVIMDILGLYSFKYDIGESKTLTILPNVIPIDYFKISNSYISDSESSNQFSFTENPNLISDIRKYAYGDNIRKIHWKISSKMNQLMSKNYDSTNDKEAIFIFDFQKTSDDDLINLITEDLTIETIISAIYYCSKHYIKFKIVFFQDTLHEININNPGNFEGVYKILSEIRFNLDIKISNLLKVYLDTIIEKTNLFIFTPNLDSELFDEVYKARNSGFNLSLILISPDDVPLKEIDTKILDYLPEIGVEAFKVSNTGQIITAFGS